MNNQFAGYDLEKVLQEPGEILPKTQAKPIRLRDVLPLQTSAFDLAAIFPSVGKPTMYQALTGQRYDDRPDNHAKYTDPYVTLDNIDDLCAVAKKMKATYVSRESLLEYYGGIIDAMIEAHATKDIAAFKSAAESMIGNIMWG